MPGVLRLAALLLTAAALASCGGDDGCDRARGSGAKLDVDQTLTREQLCAARGKPERIVRESEVERWDYGNGTGWDFRGDRGRLVVHPEEVDLTEPVPGLPDMSEGLPAAAPGPATRGRTLIGRTGCLACHRIGTIGNRGPGDDLVAAAGMQHEEIVRVLLDPEAPMPSYRGLKRADLDALATYIRGLGG